MNATSLKALLHDRERLDAILHRLHTFWAGVWLVGACGPSSAVEFAGIPLGLCFLVRLFVARRLWLDPIRTPLVALLALWAVWQGMSLLWTPDVPQGLDEMGAMRWAWSIWMIYPVLDRRRILIAAYAAGFLLGNAAQVLHYLAPDAIWHRQPDRFSGWWEPVAGGVILCSALGLHLPAAFMGHGRTRLLGAAGAAASFLGILLTGTRGAWLAGAALIALTAAFAIFRLGRRALKPALAAAVVAIIAAAAVWIVAGSSIQSRIDKAITEVRSAIQSKDYNSDTGARIVMNWWAIQAFEQHPIIGTGAGGYRKWVLANMDTTGIEPRRIHDHAHSSPLHIAATNGTIGLLITGAIVVVALRGAWVRSFGVPADETSSKLADSVSPPAPMPRWFPYDAGPLFALLGLFLVSATNTMHISAQPAAHLAILFSLCPPIPRRPARAEPTA